MRLQAAPDDPLAKLNLAGALYFNAEYEEAASTASELHREGFAVDPSLKGSKQDARQQLLAAWRNSLAFIKSEFDAKYGVDSEWTMLGLQQAEQVIQMLEKEEI
ncbi:MAG: hypothetical protein ACAH95_05490 [Fimbriimonas sp.]